MNIDLSNLCNARNAESRSISAENPQGERGKGGMSEIPADLKDEHPARDLGRGWKVRPCITLAAGETATLMDIDGPGVIRHIWITCQPTDFRNFILRVYWDGQDQPSIECPLGDFFCQSWNKTQDIFAGPINVNPNHSLNCLFPMPFRKHAKVTVENRAPHDKWGFFYTINYTLEDVPEESLYLHAQFRRSNPLPLGEDHLMVDGVRGRGHYVGAFMAWQQNNTGWWGEGEIKMFLDGDTDYPTICGTGTEDYFGGAWGFGGRNYSAPCFGYQNTNTQAAYTPEKVIRDGEPGMRCTLYRFHTHDPVFFKQDMRVTMQAIGWRSEGRYLPLQDDISSVVYWYQALPSAPFPALPDADALEII